MAQPIQRRQFVQLLTTSAGAAALSSCSNSNEARRSHGKRVLVVAFDGLDPRIIEELIQSRKLPNFARLAQQGSMIRIATSTPPHTPVAFSSIITGADPGEHQIFDFIHRDPNPTGSVAVRPYLSTAESYETRYTPSVGGWRLPISGGDAILMRRGKPYWQYLIANGIDAEVYYLPSNFPVEAPQGPGRFRAISGMGTPDLLGSYGEFTLFTPTVSRRGRLVGGGRFARLTLRNHRGAAELVGPPNSLRRPGRSGNIELMKLPLAVVRDPVNRVAKIELSGSRVLLNEGEWSEWIPVDFPTELPGSAVMSAAGAGTFVRGMVRLFAKQIHPRFELYISPINIDPLQPITPITQPPEFAKQLAKRHGRFHTLGIPEDTKALSHGALTEDQFLQQAGSVLEERSNQFRHALANFRSGCLFFYFGETDLVQHMFWRDRDPGHPAYDARQAEKYGTAVEDVYIGADRLVAEAMDAVREDDTLIVLSDHGFTTFRRGFNLNSWLLKNGYIGLMKPGNQSERELFLDLAWQKTKAYGLGMNGLYLNLEGREKYGAVRTKDKHSLLSEIAEKLLEVQDADGTHVIKSVHHVEDFYPAADPQVAPDMIIGYNERYRASWETVLGQMPQELIVDNYDRWSGTHLISAALIPGVFLSNRKVVTENGAVTDIAPTILSEFGIPIPASMSGRSLFSEV